MNIPDRQGALTLYLSREEQWIVHHVLLDRMELEARAPVDAEPPPIEVFRIFEKIEAGVEQFSPKELQHLAEELSRYTERSEAPSQDRSTTQRLCSYLQELCRDTTERCGERQPE